MLTEGDENEIEDTKKEINVAGLTDNNTRVEARNDNQKGIANNRRHRYALVKKVNVQVKVRREMSSQSHRFIQKIPDAMVGDASLECRIESNEIDRLESRVEMI